jgi:hypothetical protein
VADPPGLQRSRRRANGDDEASLRHRRLGAALAVALAAGALLAPAARADGVGVEVALPSGAPVQIGADVLAAHVDVPPTPYTIRATPGDAGLSIDHTGTSIAELLALAGVTPGPSTFVGVARPDGTTTYLDASEISAQPPFPEGPALVWTDGASTHFLRPVLNAQDVNAPDNIATPDGQSLLLAVHDGTLLQVAASATPASTAPGQAVAFAASVSNAPPGESLTYTWSFADGTTGSGPSLSHVFAAPGTYNAVVDVAGSAGSAGSSSLVTVTVAAPAPPPTTTAAAPTTPTTTGAATPAPKPRPKPKPRPTARSNSRVKPEIRPKPTAPKHTPTTAKPLPVKTPAAVPARTTPPTPTQTAAPTRSTSAAPAPTPTATTPTPTAPAPAATTPAPEPKPQPKPKPRPKPPVARKRPAAAPKPARPAPPLVHGVLIGGASAFAPAASSRRSPGAAASAPEASSASRQLAAPAGVVAACALVAAGALGEVRSRRRGGKR